MSGHTTVILWYQNEAGEKWVPPCNYNGTPEPPKGFIYQVYRNPMELRTLHINIETSKEVLTMGATFSRSEVEQMVRAGMPLDKAILIAAGEDEVIR